MSRLLPYDPFFDDIRPNSNINTFLHQNKAIPNNNNNNNNHHHSNIINNNHSNSNNGGNKVLDESEDQKWNIAAAKLAFSDQLRSRPDNGVGPRNNNNNNPILASKGIPSSGNSKQPASTRSNSTRTSSSSSGGRHKHKGSAQNEMVNSVINKVLNLDMNQHASSDVSQKGILSHASPSPPSTQSPSAALDKRFKTLPPSESLPRNETLGGYIFVCNNDTMQEDLKRQLFGLPQRYRDSVRAIQPGLPLFLYNYTTHQLHGIFEATSFGGSNIDPTAWEDKKNKGESRFPAQVRIRVRKMCKPLEEDAFRPVLFHYDGPKFRLQLSVPETLAIMDLLTQNGAA